MLGAKEASEAIGRELAYLLPIGREHEFAGLFAQLDKRLPELGLRAYGVSITTLDEVFIVDGKHNRGS